MTAGTDPDPAESSNAARMPSVVQIRHMPYLDHNYGQPPPMTPPDSSSPAPDDGDTGNEDDEDDGITRCICGFNHDDGYMICCDKCSVWQHIECMGISSTAVPENYLCDQCDPRPLDKDCAKAIQSRKREEMSDDDDDDDESDEEGDGTTYTAVSNTPTRITLTAKVSRPKRKRATGKNKGDKEKDILKKTKRRKRPKQRPPLHFVPVDEETNMPWENNGNIADNYEEAADNMYSKELDDLALSLTQNSQENVIPDGNEQYCKVVEVQKNTKGIVTTEDLNKNQFLIKCKGKVMLGSKFDSENPFFKRCSPYVLYYSKLDHLELCVDARTFGNDSRFVRRSCSPNAEVRHFIQSEKLCLAIYSLCPLPKGAEITIPFEFSFSDYKCHLLCACSQDTCVVAKYNMRCQQQSQEMHSDKEAHIPGGDESSNSGHHKLSPLRMSLSSNHSFQGDSDSDIENNPERSLESESHRKKLSREERKLEAYVKQIEKMEKKEKKRQQPSKDHRQISRTLSDEGRVLPRGIRGTKRFNHKRRSNGGAGIKRKRARLSSCSSEPLSPDEVSSSASTPTTPKTVSTIPEEPLAETPSTSPSRNFSFPKTKIDDDNQEPPLSIKTEAIESSVTCMSSPSSPCSPRESETETKPTLSTASSNSDIAMEVEMEEAEDLRVEEMCDTSVEGSGLIRELDSSLAGRLAEISSIASSESNTPSPCPSTSASPTCSESVMNGCPPIMSGVRSPGPAPGSPLASVLHGPRATRSNPLYCSLKKRWLCQFLYGYNMSDNKPPNGLKPSVRSVTTPAAPPLYHRKSYAKFQKDPLPLKKRHLKIFQASVMVNNISNPMSTSISYSISPTPVLDIPTSTPSMHFLVNHNSVLKKSEQSLEQLVLPTACVPMDQNATGDNKQQTLQLIECVETETNMNTQTFLAAYSKHSDTQSFDTSPLEAMPLRVISTSEEAPCEKELLDKMLTSEVEPLMISSTPVRRVSDPRLLSPGGSQLSTPSSVITSVISSCVNISPVLASAVQPLTVITSPIATSVVISTEMQTGTPGKKKVSLLEYRNRSRQRLSGDLMTTAPCVISSAPSPSSMSSVPIPVVKVVPNAVNVVFPRRTPPSNRRMSTGAAETNGPCFEPVSPEEEERKSLGYMCKSANSLLTATSLLQEDAKLSSFADVDPSVRKKLVQKNKEIISRKEEGLTRFSKKLSAFISEHLQKEPKNSPGSIHSPTTGTNSPSVPPPPPPPELAGKRDAMEIEDDDSQSNIFVNTPVVSSAPIQPALTEYVHIPQQVQEYRLCQQTSLLAPLISTIPPQLHSQMATQPRLSSQYLVASQTIPSHIQFPTSYQKPPTQGTSYYQQ